MNPDRQLLLYMYRTVTRYPGRIRLVRLLVRGGAPFFYVWYGAVVLAALLNRRDALAFVLAAPAGTFLAVSLLRRLSFRPRPFAATGIDPLVPHREDSSLPSRHAASAWAIALVSSVLGPAFFLPALTAALITSGVRVASGLHYPSDILAGLGLALLCTLVALSLL